MLDDDEIVAMAARYDEELLALDAELGELFAELRSRGEWDPASCAAIRSMGSQGSITQSAMRTSM